MTYLIARPIKTIADPPMITDVNSSIRAPSSVILLTHCESVAAPKVCTFKTIDVLSAVPALDWSYVLNLILSIWY